MKIYDFPAFPNPLRVRIALAEKGLQDDVEYIHVDVPAGEHKEAAFLEKNPGGAVPVLELEDGTTISECTAITEYIDHLRGDPVLTGRTPRDRAVIAMMQRRVEAGLLDAVAAYFHHATPGLGPDIETTQVAEWGNHQLGRARESLRYLDKVLATRPYIAGDEFTIADITAHAGLVFAGFVDLDIPDECTHLSAWRDRVMARPSVAQ